MIESLITEYQSKRDKKYFKRTCFKVMTASKYTLPPFLHPPFTYVDTYITTEYPMNDGPLNLCIIQTAHTNFHK